MSKPKNAFEVFQFLDKSNCGECGKKVDTQFESDISVVLYLLPGVPVMICYWLPEDGMDSTLHVFFDETADRNLDLGSVFSLGSGLAQMFTKIALRHGFDGRA